MPEINDYRDSFSRRLDQLREQQQQSLQSASAAYPDLFGNLHVWEAALQKRLDEYQLGQALPELSSSQLFAAQTASDSSWALGDRTNFDRWLQQMDQMMFDELEFGRYPKPAGFAQPVHWLEDEQSLRQEALKISGAAFIPDNMFGTRGVFHYPGRGTFVSRAFYKKLEQGDNDQLRARLIGDLARERWGWGFMLEYTTLGQAAGTAGLWPALSAQRLGLSSTSDEIAWQKAAALRRSWLLLEAGWTEWVWQFVEFKARHAVGQRAVGQRAVGQRAAMPRPGRMFELLGKIVNVFSLIISPFGVRIHLAGLFNLAKFLFFEETDILTVSLNQAIFHVQKYCVENDMQVERSEGLRLSQILGRLYFSQLESAAGILATPYAVLIAMHISSLPGKATGQDILDAVQNDLRLSPDTRLALLSRSDSRVKYDPRAMFVAAWERFQLDGPRDFFRV